MKVLNFSHPMTKEQVGQLESLISRNVDEVIDISVQLDFDVSFTEQVRELVGSVGFSNREWSKGDFVVNLPGLSIAAGLVLAEIHGRCGHFPKVIQMARSESGEFYVKSVLQLQAVRDLARQRRR